MCIVAFKMIFITQQLQYLHVIKRKTSHVVASSPGSPPPLCFIHTFFFSCKIYAEKIARTCIMNRRLIMWCTRSAGCLSPFQLVYLWLSPAVLSVSRSPSLSLPSVSRVQPGAPLHVSKQATYNRINFATIHPPQLTLSGIPLSL